MTDQHVYDDGFTIKENRWGTFVSATLDGRSLVTAGNLQACIDATRFHLKGEQEGFPPIKALNIDDYVDL